MNSAAADNASASSATSSSSLAESPRDRREAVAELSEAQFLEQQARDAQLAFQRVLAEMKQTAGAAVDVRQLVRDHPFLSTAAVTGLAALLAPSRTTARRAADWRSWRSALRRSPTWRQVRETDAWRSAWGYIRRSRWLRPLLRMLKNSATHAIVAAFSAKAASENGDEGFAVGGNGHAAHATSVPAEE